MLAVLQHHLASTTLALGLPHCAPLALTIAVHDLRVTVCSPLAGPAAGEPVHQRPASRPRHVELAAAGAPSLSLAHAVRASASVRASARSCTAVSVSSQLGLYMLHLARGAALTGVRGVLLLRCPHADRHAAVPRRGSARCGAADWLGTWRHAAARVCCGLLRQRAAARWPAAVRNGLRRPPVRLGVCLRRRCQSFVVLCCIACLYQLFQEMR